MPNTFAKTLLDSLLPREVPVPDGSKCQSTRLKRLGIPGWGPYVGSIECLECGHKESVMSYLGKTCFTVEPLDKDPPP
jgi:hypothetical protein